MALKDDLSSPEPIGQQSADRSHKLAAAIAIAYIFVILGGMAVRAFLSGDTQTLKYSLSLPSTWIVSITSAMTAWGLWQRFRWAWWLGFVAVAVQLLRIGPWLFRSLSTGAQPPFSTLLVLAMLLVFFALLLFPRTRSACTR